MAGKGTLPFPFFVCQLLFYTKLNPEQVKALFAQEAVLFGTFDGVLLTRVAELFGAEAAHAVIEDKSGQNSGYYYNTWCTGERELFYAYFPGFQYAATIANVNEICSKVKQEQTGSKVIDLPKRRATK